MLQRKPVSRETKDMDGMWLPGLAGAAQLGWPQLGSMATVEHNEQKWAGELLGPVLCPALPCFLGTCWWSHEEAAMLLFVMDVQRSPRDWVGFWIFYQSGADNSQESSHRCSCSMNLFLCLKLCLQVEVGGVWWQVATSHSTLEPWQQPPEAEKPRHKILLVFSWVNQSQDWVTSRERWYVY